MSEESKVRRIAEMLEYAVTLINKRRVDIIEKETTSGDEDVELETLQDFMGKYTDLICPYPFDSLDRVIAEEGRKDGDE